jgi:type II secretory pathway predicted ATPase ExeA
MPGRKLYIEQAKDLAKLEISMRTGALELKVSPAALNVYLKRGEMTRSMAAEKFPARLARYIDMKIAQAKKTPSAAYGAPLRGRFGFLRMTLNEAAPQMGLPRHVLALGINKGIWPDETTRAQAIDWMDQRIALQEEKVVITKMLLPEEVVKYFGLKTDPFFDDIKTVKDIYEVKDLVAAEKLMMKVVDRGGFLAVTGPRGCGKTVLRKKVQERLVDRSDIVVVFPQTVEKEHLGAPGLCDAILTDLGVNKSKHHRLEMRARYVGEALRNYYADGKKVILLIEEAHLLTNQALLALKRLYEIEDGFKKLLTIILIGQPQLAQRFKVEMEIAEVSLRVALFEIHSLNGAFANYLEHKLQRAGMNGKRIFDSTAIRAIHERMKKGELLDTPLALNNLAAKAMIKARDLGEDVVTGDIVKAI